MYGDGRCDHVLMMAPAVLMQKPTCLYDQPVPKEIPLRPVFKATTSRRTREGPCMGAAGATMC